MVKNCLYGLSMFFKVPLVVQFQQLFQLSDLKSKPLANICIRNIVFVDRFAITDQNTERLIGSIALEPTLDSAQ